MNTNLQNIASMAEIIASIGVILSLVFVGFELNEGNRETRALTAQSALQTEMSMVAVLLDHSDTWQKVISGAPLAKGEETRKAINLYQLAMLESANRYLQYKSGYLDEKSWLNNERTLPGFKALPIHEKWRSSFGGQGQNSEFLEMLDSL